MTESLFIMIYDLNQSKHEFYDQMKNMRHSIIGEHIVRSMEMVLRFLSICKNEHPENNTS